jgi:hypothetical protein
MPQNAPKVPGSGKVTVTLSFGSWAPELKSSLVEDAHVVGARVVVEDRERASRPYAHARRRERLVGLTDHRGVPWRRGLRRPSGADPRLA